MKSEIKEKEFLRSLTHAACSFGYYQPFMTDVGELFVRTSFGTNSPIDNRQELRCGDGPTCQRPVKKTRRVEVSTEVADVRFERKINRIFGSINFVNSSLRAYSQQQGIGIIVNGIYFATHLVTGAGPSACLCDFDHEFHATKKIALRNTCKQSDYAGTKIVARRAPFVCGAQNKDRRCRIDQ